VTCPSGIGLVATGLAFGSRIQADGALAAMRPENTSCFEVSRGEGGYTSVVTHLLGYLDRLGAARNERGTSTLYILYVIIAVLVIIVLLKFLGVI